MRENIANDKLYTSLKEGKFKKERGEHSMVEKLKWEQGAETINRLINSEETIVITGKTGVGKSLLMGKIVQEMKRRGKAVVVIGDSPNLKSEVDLDKDKIKEALREPVTVVAVDEVIGDLVQGVEDEIKNGHKLIFTVQSRELGEWKEQVVRGSKPEKTYQDLLKCSERGGIEVHISTEIEDGSLVRKVSIGK